MNNQNRDQEQQFTPNLQMGSGLTRYRSAPSSYFASLLSDDNVLRTDDDDLDRMFNTRAVSPETRRIFSRFINGSDTIQEEPSQPQFNPQFVSSSENKGGGGGVVQQTQQGNDYSSPSQMTYHHHHQCHSSDAAPSSFNSNQNANMKVEGGNSGLVRYNSSPAGFFANMNMDSDFGAMRGLGNFGGGNNSNNAETSSVSSTNRFKTAPPRYFTSRPSSSAMMIDPIPEIETKGDLGIKYENSWDDSEILPDNFLRGMSDENFPDANASNDHHHHQNHRLTHHLSLPKTSSELSDVENMFQDSVPCKMRAKRGCATHPRSIAERVRRTKISERMRKLQELVPNMDKQTSTSDMLDLAVEYIKDLQRQVEALTDIQSKCTCS